MKLSRAAKRHKGIVCVIICALIASAGCTAYFTMRGQVDDADGNDQATGQASPDISGEAQGGENGTDPKTDDDHVKQARSDAGSYNDDERLVQDLLNASLWAASDSGSFVKFQDGSMTISKDGQEKTQSFLIKAVGASETTTPAQNDAYTTQAVAVSIDDDYEIMTLKRPTSGSSPASVKSKTIFGSDSELFATQPSETLAVSGLPTEALSTLNTDLDAIRSAMSVFCSQRYPSATNATWDGTVTIDYDTQTATTTFTLSTRDEVKVKVVTDLLGGPVSVKPNNGN